MVQVDDGAEVTCDNGLFLDPTYNLVAPVTLLNLIASTGGDANMSMEDALEWWKKYNYYKELKDNPEQVNTNEKLVFVTALDAEAIGKLEDIRKHLNDSIGNDSLSLVIDKYANAAIVVNNEMEHRLQQVNEAYIGLLLKNEFGAYEFTGEEINNMRELAQLCPSIYGPAVYAVRSLLSIMDTLPQNYISYCEQTPNPNAEPQNNQRRAKVSPKVRDANEPDFTDIDEAALLSSSNEVGLAVRCYPNPAQNNVTIDANFNEKAFITYQVYNALGKVALQGNYTNSKLHQINTENVSNGLYLIKVFENGKVVNSSKITIQH